MITQDKITNIFCTLDEFSKKFDAEVAKGELMQSPTASATLQNIFEKAQFRCIKL